MDEISISSNSNIYKIHDSKIYDKIILNPTDYNIKKQPLLNILGKNPKYNAQKIVELFSGDKEDKVISSYRDIVSINSAAALVVSGKSDNLIDAISIAKEAINSKKTYKLLKKMSIKFD